MYDPARDIFTASDEIDPENSEVPSPNGTKRKRSSSPHNTLGEHGDRRNRQTSEPNPSTEHNDTPHPAKRSRASPEAPAHISPNAAPVPVTAARLSQIPRVKKVPNSRAHEPARRPERSPLHHTRTRSRSRSPDHRRERQYERRRSSPFSSRRTPSPRPIARTPTPPPRSPPRQRKRPGAAARLDAASTSAIRQRQAERDASEQSKAQAEAAARGVHDVVRQHYNAVPQRGREWRKTGSLIKGLRSLNNWIKAAIIQKFSPNENFSPGAMDNMYRDDGGPPNGLLVLDIGCGKGGDLQKWQSAPQKVALYVGLDPADVSIEQARERYTEMQEGGRGLGGRGGRGGRDGYRHNQHQHPSKRIFQAEFVVKDCYGEWIGDLPIIQEVGIDPSAGPRGPGVPPGVSARWGGGGFDVVTMMFCLHYAFESEVKARGMLRNVAGALKKGGRLIGVIPNSDILSARVVEWSKKGVPGKTQAETSEAEGSAAPPMNHEEEDNDDWDPETTLDAPVPAPASVATNPQSNPSPTTTTAALPPLTFGNSIYHISFPTTTTSVLPPDGVFRPPFGWKYFYFLEEAVEQIPEYVVPWEAFRALALEYDLELQYRRPFSEVWVAEKDDPVLGPLSERMGVKGRDGDIRVSGDEFEAADFYLAFCFYKT